MPISLQKMASNTAQVALQIGEDTVNVTYYPSRVTEKVFADLQGLGSMTSESILDDFGAFNDLLVSLIKSWDVYEDEEQTTLFPLDAGRFAELPFSFRVRLVEAILGDIRPETIAPQASRIRRSSPWGATSQRKASSATVRGTTPSSRRRNTSNASPGNS